MTAVRQGFRGLIVCILLAVGRAAHRAPPSKQEIKSLDGGKRGITKRIARVHGETARIPHSSSVSPFLRRVRLGAKSACAISRDHVVHKTDHMDHCWLPHKPCRTLADFFPEQKETAIKFNCHTYRGERERTLQLST